MKFSSMKLDESLLEAIDSLGFTEPTEIQQDSIKPALKGRDVLACAKTGSGKTAAFLLPIMHHLLKRERGRIYCLVLAPTRELAAQVVEHMEELAVNTDLTAAAIFGGVAMGPQLKSLERGVDILVATPGRLLDHIDQGNVDFDNVEYLVLDEADRMLDMGFLADASLDAQGTGR